MKRVSLPLVLATLWLCQAGASAGSVGFSELLVADGAGPPIEVGIWYPTDAVPRPTRIGLFTQQVAPDAPVAGRRLPLVVFSHGQGGEFAGHCDTAFALARAGFVAAALTHTGDNFRDQSRALDLANRPRQLRVLIDAMLAHWAGGVVDPARVGAFGFSSGGFTVLTAAGGDPRLSLVGPHCAAHPGFYDCRLLAAHRQAGTPPVAAHFTHDARIRAIVVAAPALGYTFAPHGLDDVAIPVQLWRAGDDEVLPSPFYAEAVAAALPRAPETHVVPHAGHYDFLAPCPDALARLAPAICTSEAGFDRTAFHRAFDTDVVAFFAHALAPGAEAAQRP